MVYNPNTLNGLTSLAHSVTLNLDKVGKDAFSLQLLMGDTLSQILP